MLDVLEDYELPDLKALYAILLTAKNIPQDRLDMSTYWAEPVGRSEFGVGCLLGHYARSGLGPISLKPINFRSELKSQLLLSHVVTRRPLKTWKHYTLHYKNEAMEAFGKSAAALLIRTKGWDLEQCFYPHGSNYDPCPPIESLRQRLHLFIQSQVHGNVAADRLSGPPLPAHGQVGN